MLIQILIAQSILPTLHREKCFSALRVGAAGLIIRGYVKPYPVFFSECHKI